LAPAVIHREDDLSVLISYLSSTSGRDELVNGDIFYTLREAQIVIDCLVKSR
jgi:hypothetical protein